MQFWQGVLIGLVVGVAYGAIVASMHYKDKYILKEKE